MTLSLPSLSPLLHSQASHFPLSTSTFMNSKMEDQSTASSGEQRRYSFLGKGSKVEVWTEEDDFKNAWFSAVILRPPLPPSSRGPSAGGKRTATAVVKYDHMLSADDGRPLVESVEPSFIRPVPPADNQPDRPFELYEVVDAFYQDIWWTGFVVKVVSDTYTVAFKSPLDLQEFRRSDMRPHWDWVDFKWVRPDKEETTGLIYIPGTEVEVNLHDEVPCHAWFPAVVIGQVGSTSFLVKNKRPDSDGERDLEQDIVDLEQIRPHPPETEDKNFDVLEKVDVLHESCWWVGLITKLLEGRRYFVTFRHKKEMKFSHSKLRPHLDWIDGKWVTKSKGVQFTSDCQEHTRRTLRQSLGSTLDGTEKEKPCSGNKQDNKKESSPRVEKSPSVLTLHMEKENHNSDGDKPVEVIPKVKKTKQHELGEMESHAVVTGKKRGRPQKSHESSCCTLGDSGKERGLSDREENRKELSPRIEELPYCGSRNMEEENHSSSGDKPVEEIPNDKNTKQQEAGEVENQTILPTLWPRKRRRDGRSKSNSEYPQPSSTVGGTLLRMADTTNSEELMEELELCEAVGDFEGVKGPHFENSCQPPITNEQKGDTETSGEIKGNGEHPELLVANSQAIKEELNGAVGGVANCTTEKSEPPVKAEVTLTGNTVRTNVQNLPFVKSYPIWKLIESMEVFKKLPQNPNFQPLMKSKEVKREGAAIGRMLNFVSLVEKVSRLQENDSREDFESIMEELDELEELGFDVKVVRGRVSELLRIKLMLESLIDKSNEVEIEIRECSDEKTKIDGDVADIDKELKKLQEKQAMLMSERMDKDSKVIKLISKIHVVNDCISSTRKSFGSLVETPW